MRMSDWSSDVCSSDLHGLPVQPYAGGPVAVSRGSALRPLPAHAGGRNHARETVPEPAPGASLCPDRRDRELGRLQGRRSEEHTSELQSLMRITYAVFSLKKKNTKSRPQSHQKYEQSLTYGRHA